MAKAKDARTDETTDVVDQRGNTDRPIKTGTISRLVGNAAYGFIYCPIDARDYFFHQSELIDCTFRSLELNDNVEFVVGEYRGRLQAEGVRRMDPKVRLA